jgi:hypothetical protein
MQNSWMLSLVVPKVPARLWKVNAMFCNQSSAINNLVKLEACRKYLCTYADVV